MLQMRECSKFAPADIFLKALGAYRWVQLRYERWVALEAAVSASVLRRHMNVGPNLPRSRVIPLSVVRRDDTGSKERESSRNQGIADIICITG